MSRGGARSNKTEQGAFDRLAAGGILCIAAAGNAGTTALSYPATYSSVMSVAAVDEARQWATFLQYNSQVEIAAPDVNVLSTVPMGTGSEISLPVGSSSIAPLAMEGSPRRNVTAAQRRKSLTKSALGLGTAGRDTEFGVGLVQAKAADDRIKALGCGTERGRPLRGVATGPAPSSEPEPRDQDARQQAHRGVAEVDHDGAVRAVPVVLMQPARHGGVDAQPGEPGQQRVRP